MIQLDNALVKNCWCTKYDVERGVLVANTVSSIDYAGKVRSKIQR